MADDPNDEEDESDLVPIKRQPKSLLASKSLPSVENALDDFILSANQKLMDVAEFTPETREKALRDEIAELKAKLAAAESKANAATVAKAPAAAGGRSWGAIIGAFVVGAGLMFAVGKLTATDAAPPATENAPTAVAPSQPTPDPVAHEPATPATAPAPPSDPVATATQPTATQPTVAAKQPKRPKQPPTAKQPKQPAAGQDGSATKPTPAGDGSGSDLYNPF